MISPKPLIVQLKTASYVDALVPWNTVVLVHEQDIGNTYHILT